MIEREPAPPSQKSSGAASSRLAALDLFNLLTP